MSWETTGPAVFSHHEPCPKCHSKDNFGVWTDGHKYCFGCKYRTAPERTLENSRRKEIVVPKATDKETFAPEIPDAAYKWLKKYELTDAEMAHYGVCYSHPRERLILPLDGQGTHSSSWVGRYFGSDITKPKYHQQGPKDCTFVADAVGNSSVLIFVEDWISAVKVGRKFASTPLLGSYINVKTLKRVSDRFSSLGVWLDPDMRKRSVQEAFSCTVATSLDVFNVFSDKDPKEHDMDFIETAVWEAFGQSTCQLAPDPPWYKIGLFKEVPGNPF